MIICTSISPTHINKENQKKAVSSWLSLGCEVYSFNSHREVNELKHDYPEVIFVPTYRTMELTYKKPLVSINAIMDWCKDQEHENFCLINSDIELNMDKMMLHRIEEQMDNSIVLANRIDYIDTYDFGVHEYTQGIDVFFIKKKFMGVYPQSTHCFGMTFWDYWIPYTALRNGIEVIFLHQKVAFHKTHKAQYNQDDWMKSGRYFMWENQLSQYHPFLDVGKMSTAIYQYIYNASKRKQI